jgi:hypothetical protein
MSNLCANLTLCISPFLYSPQALIFISQAFPTPIKLDTLHYVLTMNHHTLEDLEKEDEKLIERREHLQRIIDEGKFLMKTLIMHSDTSYARREHDALQLWTLRLTELDEQNRPRAATWAHYFVPDGHVSETPSFWEVDEKDRELIDDGCGEGSSYARSENACARYENKSESSDDVSALTTCSTVSSTLLLTPPPNSPSTSLSSYPGSKLPSSSLSTPNKTSKQFASPIHTSHTHHPIALVSTPNPDQALILEATGLVCPLSPTHDYSTRRVRAVGNHTLRTRKQARENAQHAAFQHFMTSIAHLSPARRIEEGERLKGKRGWREVGGVRDEDEIREVVEARAEVVVRKRAEAWKEVHAKNRARAEHRSWVSLCGETIEEDGDAIVKVRGVVRPVRF